METLEVGPYGACCYLIVGADPAAAVIVDPGAEPERILAALKDMGARAAAIWLTHGHMDHTGATAAVAAATGAPVYAHPADAAWAFTPINQSPPHYGAPPPPAAGCRPLADGQTLVGAGGTWQVIGTPGHTPGGVCFYAAAPGVLFSGDTLFAGTVGRTDLRGGDGRTLAASLRKLNALPDATRVYPGHGAPTTIGDEKRDNPFLGARAGYQKR